MKHGSRWSAFKAIGDEVRQDRSGTRGRWEVYRRLGSRFWHVRKYDRHETPAVVETCLRTAECARAVADSLEYKAASEPDALGYVACT
jgi:hypothetical protein